VFTNASLFINRGPCKVTEVVGSHVRVTLLWWKCSRETLQNCKAPVSCRVRDFSSAHRKHLHQHCSHGKSLQHNLASKAGPNTAQQVYTVVMLIYTVQVA
jgi:hypothetical protein